MKPQIHMPALGQTQKTTYRHIHLQIVISNTAPLTLTYDVLKEFPGTCPKCQAGSWVVEETNFCQTTSPEIVPFCSGPMAKIVHSHVFSTYTKENLMKIAWTTLILAFSTIVNLTFQMYYSLTQRIVYKYLHNAHVHMHKHICRVCMLVYKIITIPMCFPYILSHLFVSLFGYFLLTCFPLF